MLLPGPIKKLRDWYVRRRALKEIAGERWIERERAQQSAASELKAAERALARGEREAALRICEHVQQTQPETLGAYLIQVRALQEMHRSIEADAVIEAIRPRFPDALEPAVLWAECAQRRGDPAVAIKRWERVRKDFSTEVRAYNLSVRCLADAGLLDQADALLRKAMRRFPEHKSLAGMWAEVAQRRGDWPEALRRWQRVAEELPDSVPALLGIEKSLCELQRADEAEAFLAGKLEQFRGGPEPWVRHAGFAQHRHDWPEAERRWSRIHLIFPRNIAAYVGLAVALREQQRFDEAQVLLEEAMEKANDDSRPWIEHAVLAQQRRDWAEAARRWEVVRTRFPDQPVGFNRGVAALAALGRHAEAEELKSEASRRFPAKSG